MIVATNSANVFKLGSGNVQSSHHLYKLIQDYTWLSTRPWEFKLVIIRRSANVWADRVPTMGHEYSNLLILDSPPPEIVMY